MNGWRRRLTELDREMLPRLAARLRTVVDTSSRSKGNLSRRARTVLPAVYRRAHRLDERYADAAPLSLLRDVPQLALALAAAVFLAGAVAAVQLGDDDARPSAEPLATATLGPGDGDSIDAYVTRTRRVVTELAERRPGAEYLALVSLARPLPVADVDNLLTDVEPVRVYLAAPGVDDAELLTVPVVAATVPTVLPALCTATAQRKRNEAQELRRLVEALQVGTPEEQAELGDVAADADREEAESRAYEGECATAIALVVEGTAGELAELLQRPDVRAVEVAPAGAEIDRLDVQPLRLEVA